MQREYRVDLLDFYRGTLSARRLGVLVKHLSAKSALARALNDGQPPWSNLEHLIADVWVVLVRILFALPRSRSRTEDHPRRVELEAKSRRAAKLARIADLRATYEKRKRTRIGVM